MPEYLAPGVFLEEVRLKPPSIAAVSTSTTGMVGFTQRGPTVGRPVLVTNMLQFRQQFGGPVAATFGTKGELFYAVQGFFANGGRRLYVVRATAAGAATTAFATKGGMITRLAAGADAVTGQPNLTLADPLGLFDGAEVKLTMLRDGVSYANATALKVATDGVDRSTATVKLNGNIDIAPAASSYAARFTTVTTNVTNLDADGLPITTGGRPTSVTIKAADAGSWGNDLVVTVRHGRTARAVLDGLVADPGNVVKVKSAAGLYAGAWVEIDRGAKKPPRYRRIVAINGLTVELSGTALAAIDVTPAAPATEAVMRVCEFALTASYDGITETYPSLTLENVPGKFAVDVVNQSSALIQIDATTVTAIAAGTRHPLLFPAPDDGLRLASTTTGTDAAPAASDIRGVDNGPGKRSGLRALEEIADISIIAVPGWGEQSVQDAMIEQCERLKYRVALLDPEEVTTGVAPTLVQIQSQRKRFDSKYAAIYYPRIEIRDADDKARMIGPAGHMAGLCARIDNERGVYKAPANEVLRNIAGLEVTVTQGEHEVLNPEPNNINVIRDFRDEGLGLRIYGARCITSDNDWKYLPVRRLFIFIERSLQIGTQWAVFEPNDQRLWDRITDSIDSFLTRQWRDGALMGTEKGQAFYIRCGLDTMTQDDIDNGRLILEIGIAPVKPAEFVIIRIGQKAAIPAEA